MSNNTIGTLNVFLNLTHMYYSLHVWLWRGETCHSRPLLICIYINNTIRPLLAACLRVPLRVAQIKLQYCWQVRLEETNCELGEEQTATKENYARMTGRLVDECQFINIKHVHTKLAKFVDHIRLTYKCIAVVSDLPSLLVYPCLPCRLLVF